MITNAIVLAAGKGTRMKSGRLKVAHEVAGKPIVGYVLDAVLAVGVSEVYLVVGHQAETLKQEIKHSKVTFVTQEQQLGTGHAVIQVAPYFTNETQKSTVIVLAGDCPLIKAKTLENLIAIHHESNAAVTVLTTKMASPGQYGRILRGRMGTLTGIKEAKDCTLKEREITEINTGIYAFDANLLFEHLGKLNTNNTQGEYYLTDIIHILKESGKVVSAYCMEDSDQAIGINTRMDLAKTNEILYQENNIHFMEHGVTIVDPKTTFIDSTVTIGQDTIIGPFTCIHGESKIGANCEIGPHCYIRNGIVEDHNIISPFTRIEKY